MTSNVYEIDFSRGGLKPIVIEEIAIGQRVYHDGYKSGEAVVCCKESLGYTIIFENGDDASHQRLDSLSPYTRIKLREGIASAEEVAGLLRKREEKRESDRLAQARAKNQYALDVERITNELRAKYPWAAAQTVNGYAKASKNIKIELTRAFPGVKFSVRGESFSMGNHVEIRWTDGPTTAQVEAITGKYQAGNFNGMIDMYEGDRSAYGEAVSNVLGRAKYVMEQRDYTEGLYEAIGRALCGLQNVEYHDMNQRDLFGENTGDNLQWYIHQILSKTDIPVNGRFVGAMNVPESTGWDGWAKLLFETDQPASKISEPRESVEGVEVSENEAKGGIEIRFSEKPSADTLAALKSAGWRWSRFNHCWYSKATEKSRAFAASLIPSEPVEVIPSRYADFV